MPTFATPAPPLRVFIAQLNTAVGDIPGNTQRIVGALAAARSLGADLAVFPELAVTGYPPEDLLMRPSFLAANEAAVAEIAAHTAGLTAVVGFADRAAGDLYNAAAVLHDGRLVTVYHKAYLPNYSVFDEERYFDAGETFPVFDRGGACFGVSICEDIWYPNGPPQLQALAGAEVLVNISASPYEHGKAGERDRMLATRAADGRAFVVYCNLVGGQDELVFDGNSLVIGPDGNVIARGRSFAEDCFAVDLHPEDAFRSRLLDPRIRKARGQGPPAELTPRFVLGVPADAAGEIGLATVDRPDTLTPSSPAHPPLPARDQPTPLEGLAEIYAALVLGTRDYAAKNGFVSAVLGLSGGIDSALCAVVAADALGADKVVGVAMPSRFSSPSSMADAEALAANLGFPLRKLEIDQPFQAYLDLLTPVFGNRPPDVTEENLQPRIRGTLLMALSNKFGHLVLTTGNKSEISVGYVTLYGDSVGGFAPLKDVPKTMVYALARWRNAHGAAAGYSGDAPIPEHSITRPPSAELRPDQLDVDSLPPYEVLDPILLAYVEEEKSVAEIVAQGFDCTMVEKVVRMVDRAEYKRRQSPPGVKITGRAFGRDRRMPITQKAWRG